MRSITQIATCCAALLFASLGNSALAADVTSPYPGELTVDVDMTQAARKLTFVHESIPVRPGPLTLYYPKWIPGDHAPAGPITDVAGLVLTANGEKLSWQRDLVDMYAIHVTIPVGVKTLRVDFDLLSAVHDRGRGDGDESQSPEIDDLQFNQVVFYPSGYVSAGITVKPSIMLPAGWHFATALVPHTGVGGGVRKTIEFSPVTLNNLVDSPIISGRYFRQIDLTKGANAPVKLDMVADAPSDLAITQAQINEFRRLVTQERRMFGAHHYTSYHMLVTLSDHISNLALEHHQSFDIRTSADALTSDDVFMAGASVFPHEYTHSWNGKFRRPADLWTPDFNSVAMKGDLLWVYEGLTEYWADVMSVRAGFWTASEFRQSLAMTAADMDHVPGRTWESLQDVVDMASLKYYVPVAWSNWRRGTDFYPEGVLLWLDVDTKMRQLSHDRRSLDDFARLFYGMDNGSYLTKTYTFGELVKALKEVVPYDWATFLRDILDSHAGHATLSGIGRGGYKLVYTSAPSTMWEDSHEPSDQTDVNAMYSVGFKLSPSGEVVDVLWGGPAFKAGLSPGMRVIAINGRAYSPETLKDAVATTANSTAPIMLLVQNDAKYLTLHVNYNGGLHYPHLKRFENTPDYIDQIAAPRKQ